MAKKTNPFRRIRPVFLRSSLLTKCVVLVALIATTVALLALTAGIRSAQASTAANRAKADILLPENQDLQNKCDSMGSVEGNKALAEEYFGLVDPDTVVITPVN